MLILDTALIVALFYSYLTLIDLIKEFHNERYKQVKKQMKFFIAVETIPLIIDALYTLVEIVNEIYPKLLSEDILYNII